jgi:uncharacterized membrane protein
MASIVLIILALALSGFLYTSLPGPLASHWGVDGNVNGYMPKLVGALILPLMMIAITVIFNRLPSLDPHPQNILSFKKYYHRFKIVILAYLVAYSYSLYKREGVN